MAFRKRFSVITASLGVFFFMFSSFAEKAPYPSFAKDATSAPPAEHYDYIIIGGGTAGCALAATLSASSKVVVLERGGLPYDNPNVTHRANFWRSLSDTSPTSASQPFVSTDGVSNNRGRSLGGSSAINGGFYSRASSEYVKEVGWDPLLVNRSYEWVERKVAFRPTLDEWQGAVREGLLEAGVLPDRGFTYEHLQGTKTGGSMFDGNGYRHTSADLLEYADPTMITVYLHATVCRILFTSLPGQKPKAYGVLFRDSNQTEHTSLLKNKSSSEVILSAGALGSPQLLMLSGIGPAHKLKAHGIDVVLDQPMVGQGMSDNPMNEILVPSPRPIGTSLVQIVGITNDDGNYIETLTANVDQTWANIVGQEFSQLANQSIQAGLIVEKVARPFSTGFLELQSGDPNDNPRVTFNYFKDSRDIQKCVKGMEILRGVFESRALSTFRYSFTSFQSLVDLVARLPTNLRTRNLTSPYSLEQFCVDTVVTIWHYHGGCQVDRVVDREYRVFGLISLRVIDGSTFYESPGTNPQATLMMLGRYMGQKILMRKREKEGYFSDA